MLTRTWSTVLFDMDGTIIDSAPGILEALAHMHESMGLSIPSEPELMSWIGPPILDSMRERAGLSGASSARALQVYRDYYRPSAAQAPVFPGVAGVLEQVHAAGIPIALATSKPETVAVEILRAAGLLDYFSVTVGASEDEQRSAKADVVGEALRRLEASGVDLSAPVMVGDRLHDTEGASAHGVPTILVEWGYGGPHEADDALAVVHSADGLRALLLG